tara:strand:- start:8814 stop:9197 length:384 start_codon:yes stop_codon:yes gene_type:complete
MRLEIVALLALGVVTLSAADQPAKNEPTAAETEQQAEIAEATKLTQKLSSYKKGKLTRLVKSGTKEDLMNLPRIGEATADRIISARPFDSSAHLVTVKGIGLKTFAKIVDFVDKGDRTVTPKKKTPG